MIKYYQELLNECIDLNEWKKVHKDMLSTLEIMKDKLNQLNAAN